MGVSFASYEIARSGLFVSERGLYVTGHNISNVNTPGYVRQQAMFKNGPYETTYSKGGSMVQLGLGADIQQIRQIRHSFLDNIYRQENTTLGYWEARRKTFQDVQAILGEPMGAGLQNVLNQFWDSWQELSKEPDSLTVRALVRQRGEAMVYHINHLGTQLDKLQNDLNSEIRVRVDEVNQITEQIAKMNVAILQTEVSGDTANDYRDQRNNLIDRLTKLVNAEITEMQDGQIDVTLGGYFVVQKGIQTKLYTAERNTGELFYVPKLAGTNIEIPLRSGTIKGLLESRGEVSGAIGSTQNGTPNTKADVTFVVDVSSSSGLNMGNVISNITSYAQEMKKRGLDFNFRLVTTHGNNVVSNNSYDQANFNSFLTAVGSLAQVPATTATSDFTTVFNAFGAMTFRPEDNKYAVIFTNDDASGETGGYNTILNNNGVKASVVTDTGVNWNLVTNGTSGQLYTGVAAAVSVGLDINNDRNADISLIGRTNNIISDLRTRLNALVNILCREVNTIHKSGKTMKGNPPADGDDFFTSVNSLRPLEMGNIRLNSNLVDLNNVAASISGAKGDNSNALRIANLRHESLLQDAQGILSTDEYYQAIILEVGNNGSDAMRISENQDKLVKSADASRTAITGVSMDEEMSNMMKYKFAYDASSRAINVIDEMIATVIEKMGLAGR